MIFLVSASVICADSPHLFSIKGDAFAVSKSTEQTVKVIQANEDISQHIRKVTGNDDAKSFAGPKVVLADKNLQEKAAKISKVMKKLISLNKKAPETLQEADQFIQQNLSMTALPTKCFEYQGVFYFSGGTSSKLVEDFSSGFAIKKGESTIYTWTASDKLEKDK